MNRHHAITAFIIASFVAFSLFAATSSSGSSATHKVNALIAAASSISVALVAALAATIFWRRRGYRNYSILLLALSCLMLTYVSWNRMHQNSTVIESLESAYDSIASLGPPFPTETEIHERYLDDLPASYSTGYWVASDRQSFEIYYHDSSDSFTMKYPDAIWDWRGNEYTGPDSAR